MLMRVARVLLVAIACVLVGSQLCTDRLWFLQWAWWVPRVFLAAPLAVGGIALWLGAARSERTRARVWASCAVVLALFTSWQDWGFPKSRPEGSTRVLFWNVCCADRGESAAAFDVLLAQDADVWVLTDPCQMFADGRAERLASLGYAIARPGVFAIVSRKPINEATPLFAARQQSLSRAGIAVGDRALVIDAVDLPSEPTLPRYQTVRSFVGSIDGLRVTPADITVGDFNITRGSASLALLAPGAREAFATAGVGWGGTYSRTRPLLAIDQMLVGERWRAARAEVFDPTVGRHRALVVDLVPVR